MYRAGWRCRRGSLHRCAFRPRSGALIWCKCQLSGISSGLAVADGLPGGLAVSGAAVAGGAGYANGLGAGGWRVEVVEVGFGHGAVEADCFVVIDRDRATAWS